MFIYVNIQSIFFHDIKNNAECKGHGNMSPGPTNSRKLQKHHFACTLLLSMLMISGTAVLQVTTSKHSTISY